MADSAWIAWIISIGLVKYRIVCRQIFDFKNSTSTLQLLEAAWCLTNIGAGRPEETKSLLPALPLLIAHLGGSHYQLYSFPTSYESWHLISCFQIMVFKLAVYLIHCNLPLTITCCKYVLIIMYDY